MAILVTCRGCHTRFNVQDKFAGKSGACPKCKAPITVPQKSDEVKIDAPNAFGPKNSAGQATLKPISRKDAKLSPVTIVAIVGASLMLFVVAFVVGRSYEEVPSFFLGLGAVLLAAPLVFAGYTFLRDDEFEPYRGLPLTIRVAACSTVYAALWGLFAYTKVQLGIDGAFETPWLVAVFPTMIGIGAVAAHASLDMELGPASLHYGLYLAVTVLLRLTMGILQF